MINSTFYVQLPVGVDIATFVFCVGCACGEVAKTNINSWGQLFEARLA